MTRAAVKNQPMACLQIGFVTMLLNADKAMKVAALLQDAYECDRDFLARGIEDVYVPSRPVSIEFRLVRPNQVRSEKTPPKRDAQLLLGD